VLEGNIIPNVESNQQTDLIWDPGEGDQVLTEEADGLSLS
jgi:hypothetical protein